MLPKRHTYSVEIAGLRRELPLFEVAPGLQIAVFNILGDTELIQACASALAAKLQAVDYDLIVTAEAKSIPLAHALSLASDKEYAVLRKVYKPYMGETIQAETHSITTAAPQTLYLDEKDRRRVDGRRVALVDDVISTGSTLHGMRKVMQLAGAVVVAEAAVFTEGDAQAWEEVIALGHLPLFRGAAS
ncbi:MAG TPA: phosphoribosyltransferase family protein [Anaerolineales bacterium]|nr:phosphoribosyltransferase family protein [Anaerolineales bacterium]